MNNKYSLPKDGGLIAESTPRDIIHRYEKIHTTVYENEYLGVQYVADTIIKAIISNSNATDLEDFSMQAAVPKYMKVQMKPISDPVIPANNEDVSTQLIRVRNNAFGEVGEEEKSEG